MLALLAGPTFVPLARAACALPKADTTTCPSCASVPMPAGATVAADRSCCAAPASLAERDPATVALDRGAGDTRLLAVAVTPSVGSVPVLLDASGASRARAHSPGSSPPLLRTTILLI